MTDVKQVMPFIVMIAVLVILAVLLINLMNYRLKKRLLDQGNYDEAMLRLFRSLSGNDSDVLKWGILLLFGGIGLVVLEYLPHRVEDSPLPYGVEAIFLSMGFLLYYRLLKKDQKP